MARGDLTDTAWEKIAPYLPPERNGKQGHPYNAHRDIINGILWITRTGAPWRDLPERYGPWQTCYDRLARWQRSGLWQRVLQGLQGDADTGEAKEAGRLPGGKVEWGACAVDSTSIKAHPHAAGARRAPAKKGALVRRCARMRR